MEVSMWKQRVQASLSRSLEEVGRKEMKDTSGGLENAEGAILAADGKLVGGQGQFKCSNALEPWPDLTGVLNVSMGVFMHLHSHTLLSLCLPCPPAHSGQPPPPPSSVHPSFLPSFSK